MQLVYMHADEGWNIHGTCVDEVKLLQVRFGSWYTIHVTPLGSNFCWWAVEHSIIFIYYPTCADEVKLVQMRSGTLKKKRICYFDSCISHQNCNFLWDDTRIVPCDNQLWAMQCTWSSYRNNWEFTYSR